MSDLQKNQFNELNDKQSSSIAGGYGYGDSYSYSYSDYWEKKVNKISVPVTQVVDTKNNLTSVNAGYGRAKNAARTSGKNGFGGININIGSYY